jgi:hypothetical protein
MNCGTVADWTTAFVATCGIIVGLRQYLRSDKWQRLEWIGREVKSFRSDPLVQSALWMLDWEERDLALILPFESNPLSFTYKQEMLIHALSSKSSPQQHPYADSEISIRDSFDRLFAGLELFESFIESDLVSAEELKPHLAYWIEVIANAGNSMKSPNVRARILAFMKDYEYDGCCNLIRRFGWQI